MKIEAGNTVIVLEPTSYFGRYQTAKVVSFHEKYALLICEESDTQGFVPISHLKPTHAVVKKVSRLTSEVAKKEGGHGNSKTYLFMDLEVGEQMSFPIQDYYTLRGAVTRKKAAYPNMKFSVYRDFRNLICICKRIK